MPLQMSDGTIRALIDRPAPALLLAFLTVALSTEAMVDQPRLEWAELLLVGAVAVASLRTGAAGGLVAGLAGAAAHIALHSGAGGWGPQAGLLPVIVICAYIFYGWLSGMVGTHHRRQVSMATQLPAAAGAGGSQGLLTADEGRAFLAIEGRRALLSGEQPCILTVRLSVHDGVPAASAAHALRAVARTFEASAAARMHPVLFAENQLAMVMLGGYPQDLHQFQRTLVAAMADATFADRESGTRPKASTVLSVDSSCLVLPGAPSPGEAVVSVPLVRRRDAGTPVSVRVKAA